MIEELKKEYPDSYKKMYYCNECGRIICNPKKGLCEKSYAAIFNEEENDPIPELIMVSYVPGYQQSPEKITCWDGQSSAENEYTGEELYNFIQSHSFQGPYCSGKKAEKTRLQNPGWIDSPKCGGHYFVKEK
tara:strand:+ start:93 stop:488 length:396 start_codon:yes stop_codon:yes gene_type:complete